MVWRRSRWFMKHSEPVHGVKPEVLNAVEAMPFAHRREAAEHLKGFAEFFFKVAENQGLSGEERKKLIVEEVKQRKLGKDAIRDVLSLPFLLPENHFSEPRKLFMDLAAALQNRGGYSLPGETIRRKRKKDLTPSQQRMLLERSKKFRARISRNAVGLRDKLRAAGLNPILKGFFRRLLSAGGEWESIGKSSALWGKNHEFFSFLQKNRIINLEGNDLEVRVALTDVAWKNEETLRRLMGIPMGK